MAWERNDRPCHSYFAAWVANKKLPADFIAAFNKATATGMQHINEIVAKNKFEEYSLLEYYTKNIIYFLDEPKLQGLQLFLQKLTKPAVTV
ncbi:MAG: hypothetical protein WDM90_23735 [Ferruginibacter sp.]